MRCACIRRCLKTVKNEISIAEGSLAPAAASTECCTHCGEAARQAGITITEQGKTQHFCCEGCLAAYQWIRNAGLHDYYRLRTESAGRVSSENDDFSVWDREETLAQHAHSIENGKEITLLTDGMRCAACAWLIDKALTTQHGVHYVSANAVTGRIQLGWNPEQTPLSTLLQRLQALGYRPWLATGSEKENAQRKQYHQLLIRVGVAGLGAMQAMMFSEAFTFSGLDTMPMETRTMLRWVTCLLSAPVVFYAGWPFIAGMLREIRGRQLGMDTLIASSTLLAYFASLYETLRVGAHVWYDAAVMFVFLLLVARLLEQRARSVASAQVDALARAKPAFAYTQDKQGQLHAVAIHDLKINDDVYVPVGEPVPADGVLIDAEAYLEEALLTGEAKPVAKQRGDVLYAGSLCREQPLRMQVMHTGADTRLSQLTRLVERAQAYRPAIAQRANRLASYFVVSLFVAAVLIYLGWRWYEPARAFEVVLSFLVISCPCALSLSIPTALATANSALARMGALLLKPEAFKQLTHMTDIVFDKTGTLSDGKPVIAHVDVLAECDQDAVLCIAAAMEQASHHPLAHAFAEYSSAIAMDDVSVIAGKGIEAYAQGKRYRLGMALWAGAETDDGAIWLTRNAVPIARFVIREQQRDGAAQLIDALRAHGLTVHLSSGDGQQSVHAFAQAMGIEHVHARQTPEQKLELVRSLQQQGKIVAMVGDGINDAPVLAAADTAIVMGEGASLAQSTGDIVLSTSRLSSIPALFALAHKTRKIIRENLAWATAYNLIALPLAAFGLVTPWIAAVGMAVSSLIVTVNALRLLKGVEA